MRTKIITVVILLAVPVYAALGNQIDANFSFKTASLLNPDELFKALRENITIPIGTSTGLTLPSPQESLKEAGKLKPQIDKLNQQLEENTGVNAKKLISFLANIAIKLFQTIISSLSGLVDFLK